jgi:glycosyltransferase involved in cell wall biosynthesis
MADWASVFGLLPCLRRPRPGQRDIMVAVCTLGKVRIEHEVAFHDCCLPMNRVRRLVVIKNLGVSEARNMAVQIAKTQGCEILIFWDDDVIPRSPACLQSLINAMNLNPKVDIIGGVYPIRGPIPEPIVAKKLGDGAWWGWVDGKIHRVHMTGTGFLAIRMKSLEKIKAKTYEHEAAEAPGGKITLTRYFAESQNYTPHPEKEGELLARATDDFYFAELAAKARLKWYVEGRAVCDQIDLDGTIYRVEQGIPNFAEGPSAVIRPSVEVREREKDQCPVSVIT